MKWPNAFGFCLVGLSMLWLPALAPGFLAPNSAMGMGTGEIWLIFMGTINTSLGAGFLGWQAIKQTRFNPIWLEPVAMSPAPTKPSPSALPQPSQA